ncbi:D-cysteine desulfhydrase, mitochondrial [Raphidocelis subcapitata]|uniref:D-cysteine desulfhydrase n=1 Tax=Raphidocelis subcapitata TaxID=307507 RepID=A0A2V0NSW9_9CHLO|nr:D-cysteine desulfhydrase, mitochondrial [Raphidocelis subcapitata]|eukprot:GBF88670.1 D-cysteine desulfhydrase, mitochondrial [Raphidocelis subcapitata]
MAASFLKLEPFTAPNWARGLKAPPQRYRLGLLPTPVHRFSPPGLPDGVEMWIKRDDLSGMQMSGNKVRKLEFLMADAKASGADCVVTVGGIQSNHTRATAVAARYLGLEPHLVLRTSRALAGEDPGLVGNLLVERLAGAVVHKITKEEYGQLGGDAVGAQLVDALRAEGRRPYFIPVGGSNSLGCWGYMTAVEEICQQSDDLGFKFDDIVMACGSGGTTAGLALGNHLSGYGARVHAYGVCDDPDYFYDYVDGLYAGLGWTGADARATLAAVQARGLGYAISAEDELDAVASVAAATGIVLDPVYSGKALHQLLRDVAAAPAEWEGRRVLFVHTGGLLGMYDKLDQLQPLVEAQGRQHRMKVKLPA